MLLYHTSLTSIILTMCLEYTGTFDHPVAASDYDHPVVASPLQSLPHIEQYHGVNQTVQQGDTAYIGCKVYNVGNR